MNGERIFLPLQKFFLSEFTQDVVIPIILVLLLALLVNPLGWEVPLQIIGVLLGVTFFLFLASVALLQRVSARTAEGQSIPVKSISDRIAFFAVSVVLISGIVVQSLLNVLDIWLAVALAALIGGKVWGRVHEEFKNE